MKKRVMIPLRFICRGKGTRRLPAGSQAHNTILSQKTGPKARSIAVDRASAFVLAIWDGRDWLIFYLGIDMLGDTPQLAPYGALVHWRHRGKTANAAYLDGHVAEVQASTGYVVAIVSGSPAGHLTSGDVSATSPYGSVP